MQAKRLREEVINKIKRCSSYDITQPNLSTDNISDKSQTFQRKKNNHKKLIQNLVKLPDHILKTISYNQMIKLSQIDKKEPSKTRGKHIDLKILEPELFSYREKRN
jgi:hypothetical protein